MGDKVHTKVYCRFSKSEMRAHYGDLVSHAKTEKHVKCQIPFSMSELFGLVQELFCDSFGQKCS